MPDLRPNRGPRWRAALLAGVIAGPVFVTTALVEGARRPHYDPIRHPISSLALGPRRSVQVANFLLSGALYGGFALGLWRTAGERDAPRAIPVFVGNVAAGLVLSGLFSTDPVSGYPPDTPDETAPTIMGTMHNLAALPLVVGVSGAALAEASRSLRAGQRAWAAYSAGSGLLMPSAFLVAGAGFAQQPRLVARAGLVQRIAVGTGLGWLTALAVHRLRPGSCSLALGE